MTVEIVMLVCSYHTIPASQQEDIKCLQTTNLKKFKKYKKSTCIF